MDKKTSNELCVCDTDDFGTLGCCDNKYSPNPQKYFVSFNILADEEEKPKEVYDG